MRDTDLREALRRQALPAGTECAHRDPEQRYVKCRALATGYHGTSGVYVVPTCDEHRSGGVIRLGLQYFAYQGDLP